MSKMKLGIYFALFIALISNISGMYQNQLFLCFIVMLYIDAKEPNIRSLIVLLTVVWTIFYEVDYFLYFFMEKIWFVDIVTGDLILNLGIICTFVSYLFVIYYRHEISDFGAKLLYLPQISYVPTKADVIQLILARLGLTYHLIMTLYLAYVGYDYVIAYYANNTDAIEAEQVIFMNASKLYVEWGINIELIRQFSIVVVVHDWTKTQSGANRPSMRYKD